MMQIHSILSIFSLLVVLLWENVYGLGLRPSLHSRSIYTKGKTIVSPLYLSEKNAFQDILNIKLIKIIKQIAPIFGYYAVMLAPIYGIGLVPFLGSMTDFSSLRNRGSPGMTVHCITINLNHAYLYLSV